MKHLLRISAAWLLLTVTAFGVAGCGQVGDFTGGNGGANGLDGHTPVATEDGRSFADYFDGQAVNFYRQTNSTTLACEAGACPETTDISGLSFTVKNSC